MFHSWSIWGSTIVNCVACHQIVSCSTIWWRWVSGYDETIEPQGHLSKRNKISEYYGISQNTTVLINPWLVNTTISKYHATVLTDFFLFVLYVLNNETNKHMI